VLPVVPMFHVNAWGIPYAAAMTGTKPRAARRALDGDSLFELLESERVTMTAGVPTVWMNLLACMQQHGRRFSTLRASSSAARPRPRR
jgi:acyl-CoA synthetase (AMP-forming)/AMP-acid ligase II